MNRFLIPVGLMTGIWVGFLFLGLLWTVCVLTIGAACICVTVYDRYKARAKAEAHRRGKET